MTNARPVGSGLLALSCRSLVIMTLGLSASCLPGIDTPSVPEPVQQRGTLRARQVGAGQTHSCALRLDGEIQCWGSSLSGDERKTPPGPFTSFSFAGTHGCGLYADGRARCWGEALLLHIEAPSELRFTQLSTSEKQTCGLLQTGGLRCWGDVPDELFTQFTQDVAEVAVGRAHACARKQDGRVVCWQDPGAIHPVTDPTGTFTAITSGRDHSCGLRTDGTAQCWGNNDQAQCDAPPGAFRALSAGKSFSCGLRDDGRVECWGQRPDGYDHTALKPLYRAMESPEGRFQHIAAGDEHACGIDTSDRVVCWGDNSYEQLDVP